MKINKNILLKIVISILIIIGIFINFKDDILDIFNNKNLDFGDDVYVHFIDVGQGDSTLIQSKDGVLLIDAGESDKKDILINYLHSFGVKSIDYVIATHPHSDHIGGIRYVLDEFNVKNIMMPNVVHNSITFEKLLNSIESNNLKIEEPISGKNFYVGDIKFIVLAPNSKNYENLNNYSIVLKMIYGNTKFLFTGDAEKISEDEILRCNYDLLSDVYKAGHHGSSTSSSKKFLQAIRPKAVVVSCGKNNRYGHPHREVIERFNNMGINVYRTDELGTIVMKTNGKNISVNLKDAG